jgi:HAD superfamily hydrolase (TIGR01662 family)
MKLVIFDLDGTLTPQRPSSTAPFERRFLGGVQEACSRLRAAGVALAIASNQGGVPKGLALADVHEHLGWVCKTLDVAVYRLAWEEGRKKPGPAMLLEIMSELGVPPAETCFVGGAEADRLAAEAAGVQFHHARAFLPDGLP